MVECLLVNLGRSATCSLLPAEVERQVISFVGTLNLLRGGAQNVNDVVLVNRTSFATLPDFVFEVWHRLPKTNVFLIGESMVS